MFSQHSKMELPEKWNKQVAYSWRYDPCELQGGAAHARAKRAPRGPLVEDCVTDDEAMDED